jgi:hypothetical protein
MGESEALVFGLHRNEERLEYAICHLRNVGFLGANFSVFSPLPQRDPQGNLQECISDWSEVMIGTFCEKDILLSVRCESSGQAVIARKILECTEADTILCSVEHIGGIPFRTGRFSNLA